MIENAIRNFPSQFSFEPVIENAQALPAAKKFLVCGMGGSNLVAGLLKIRRPELDIIEHRGYGLPATATASRLTIICSYSGNTEETLDSFAVALRQNFPMVVITTGGKLLALAKEKNIPYVLIPDTGIQPRSSIGFQLRALMAVMGEWDLLEETGSLKTCLDGNALERRGRELAAALGGKVPVIYASSANATIAYNWKIKFNETGKVPAFFNVFSELNHNEMTGFDVIESTRALSENFHFIFLLDAADHERIQKRLHITKTLYEARHLGVTVVEVSSQRPWEKIFASLLLADWTAMALAEHYGAEAEQVPLVEEFKKLME